MADVLARSVAYRGGNRSFPVAESHRGTGLQLGNDSQVDP